MASHLICPFFLDDSDPIEREIGMAYSWCWEGDPHWFFTDLGVSDGMLWAQTRCADLCISYHELSLEETYPEYWSAFQRGEWPPHTDGFELNPEVVWDDDDEIWKEVQ